MRRETTCTAVPKRHPRNAHLFRHVSREPQERITQHEAHLVNLIHSLDGLAIVPLRCPQEKLELILHAYFQHVASSTPSATSRPLGELSSERKKSTEGCEPKGKIRTATWALGLEAMGIV
ncbi:hypothetical protein MRB53_008914 [Persea americana]|uniref:Uncharacterized protein n=1 Tax=Persea americana TaxID=3435 RepID=A0ACC2LMI3_PERAE|nr:hypothetical protein MRB53_008914 [Persea americana]